MDISKITAHTGLNKNSIKRMDSSLEFVKAKTGLNTPAVKETPSISRIELEYRTKEATAKTLGGIQDFDFLI